MDKVGTSSAAGRNVHWEQPLWRKVCRIFKNPKRELPSDPEILVLGIYLEKTIVRKDTCTSAFIGAILK